MYNAAAVVYAAGVVIGLLVMRDRWSVRLLTAALWPVGVLAFVVVTVMLLAAAVYLWPVPLVITIAVVAALSLLF